MAKKTGLGKGLEAIFANNISEEEIRENEVIEVRKTDKVGINQRQDTSCSVFY